jgi:anti-sigma B factor antagonist
VPFDVGSEVVEGEIHVIAVRGEIDLSTAPELREPLERALQQDQPSILIDLTECDFVDSTGVALIVEAWQRVGEQEDGRIALCCPNPQVRRVLEITGIEGSIGLHTERDAALAQLRV